MRTNRLLLQIAAAPLVWLGHAGASNAAPPNCLVTPTLAASGSLGYRLRGQRCEGLLRRLVGNSTAINLLGYHAGTIDFDVLQKQPLVLSILGNRTDKAISLRARAMTLNYVYQMDSAAAKIAGEFTWPNDIARDVSINRRQFGAIACTQPCADGPGAEYWPVRQLKPPGLDAKALFLVLRSDAYGTNLSIRLKSKAGVITDLKKEVPDLDPQGITIVPLPDSLEEGTYALTVQAREKETRDPMGALFATIYVPALNRE